MFKVNGNAFLYPSRGAPPEAITSISSINFMGCLINMEILVGIHSFIIQEFTLSGAVLVVIICAWVVDERLYGLIQKPGRLLKAIAAGIDVRHLTNALPLVLL